MIDTTEYWPALHRLSETSDRQGMGTDERLDAIVKQFLQMPPQIRRQLIADVLRLSLELPDVYAAVTAAANQAEEQDLRRLRRGETG